MTIRLILLLAALPVLAADPAVPWHHPLYLSGHGFWPWRAAVQVQNDGTKALVGEPSAVAVPGLAGARSESVRVCTAAGQEVLFEVLTASGSARRDGLLAADDRIVVPLECGARSGATLFIYAGNDQAWPVPDFLRAGMLNGGFESGAGTPEGWTAAGTDEQHRLAWDTTGGHAGARCVKAEVSEGAPAAWVQWRQTGLAVTPGRRYELSGWVRGENVKGRAGWFVHVDGERPQMINQLATIEGGTRPWQKVQLSFIAPAAARTASVGTVLYGTGTAWYDDVAWTTVAETSAVQVAAGPVEKLALAAPSAVSAPQFSADWPVRAVLRAYNLSDHPLDPVLIMADLRPTLGRWMKIQPGASVRVVDAASGREMGSRVRSGNNLLFSASLPPRAIREFHLYLNPLRKENPDESAAGYQRLVDDPMNLAPRPGSNVPPVGWTFSDERNRSRYSAEVGLQSIMKHMAFSDEANRPRKSAGVAGGAGSGPSILKFTIPTNLPAAWNGWRSGEIPIRPGASYFYSGLLMSAALKGSASLHGHWHAKDGKMTASSAFISTHPTVTGDSDWTQSSALVQAPPDATSLQLHLTMNAHGTLLHDGLLFCEVQRAEVVRLEVAEAAAPAGPLHVWQANPLIKVFPEDPPAPPAAAVALECARNECEPFQLVARGNRALKAVQAACSSLRSSKGDTLPVVKIERVGFVPIDHPSGYFQAKVEDWQRKLPHGAGATDGWEGNWPDPLLPAAPCDLAAHQNQPFWFTVRTGSETPAGDYQGQVTLRAEGCDPVTLPLTVKVLPFALPDRTRLRSIFDFRFGPGGGFGAGAKEQEDRRVWLRFMAEHRLGINAIEPPPVFSRANGKVTMDATRFDESARFCFEELGMNVSYTPHFFYQFGWAYPPKQIFGLEPLTPEWNRAFQEAYRLFSDHLKAKGWHDRFVYYISDEPHFDRDFVREQMKKLCALIHEVDPKIPIYSSTWRHCPEWDQSLDLWGVGQYGCFPVADLEQVRKAGRQFWFTCDGQMATDTPYLATERMLPYYCFKYGATGFEFWGLAWWTYDPWKIGWHNFIRQSDDGQKHYWIRYPNGDGFLTYPGKLAGVDGPLSTIRLEQVREGLEDHEALMLLAELAEKAARSGRTPAKAVRTLDMARELVVIPNAGGLRSSEILADPDRIPAIRKAVNEAIVELMR